MTEIKLAYPDITFAAQSIASSATYDTSFPVKNIVNGPLWAHAKLQQAIAGQHTIEWDLGSGGDKSAEYFALLRARQLKKSGVDQITLRGSDASYLNWQALSWTAIWDFSRDYTIDSVNRLSQIDDLTGNGNHATQGTQANQPILSRADNKENLCYPSDGSTISGSDNLSSNTFSGGWRTIVADTTVGRQGTWRSGMGGTRPTGTALTMSIRVKYVNWRYIWIGARGYSSWHGRTYDFDTDTFGGGSSYVSSTSEVLPDGSVRITISYLTSSATTADIGVYLNSSFGSTTPTTWSPAAAGTESVQFTDLCIRETAADSDFISTTDVPVWRGINGNRAAVFDGTDDYVSADSAATPFAGDDKPFSCFIVGNLFRLKNYHTWITLNSTSSTNPYHDLYASSSAWGSYRAQDSGAASSLLGGTADTAIAVLSFVFTGTTISAWHNETQFFSASAHNVGTATFDRLWLGALKAGGSAATDFLHGKIAFAAIIPGALDDTNREAIETYLINRFQTTPAVTIDDLDELSTIGKNNEHYIEYFTETDPYRYWVMTFDAESETTRQIGKVMFGKLFDFGRDPVRNIDLEGIKYQDKGIDCVRYFTLPYEGITPTKREEFRDKIGQYKDENLVAIVSEDGNPLLMGSSIIPCAVKNYEFRQRNTLVNNASIDLEELQ